MSIIIHCSVFPPIRRRRSKRAKEADEKRGMEADKDENPVYGIYYASDGNKIDAGVNEITDESQYYAT